jgi:hypothetical protein
VVVTNIRFPPDKHAAFPEDVEPDGFSKVEFIVTGRRASMEEGTERGDAPPEIAGAEQKPGTRLQQGGEGATTRFGMENGDNTDVAATGGLDPDEEVAAHPS